MVERETTAVAAIRRFNRFHTRWIGALGGNLHGSGFALIEARVLYELAERDGCLAVELSRDLDLDPAYLSRILKRFEGKVGSSGSVRTRMAARFGSGSRRRDRPPSGRWKRPRGRRPRRSCRVFP